MTADAERKMQFLYALRAKGVTNTAVMTAMERIDRGNFIRGVFSERAYEDVPLPISCGQTISAWVMKPTTEGWLMVWPHEIGSGTSS